MNLGRNLLVPGIGARDPDAGPSPSVFFFPYQAGPNFVGAKT